MKRLLGILGLMIAVVAVKAVAWVAENGSPPSLMPQTVGDTVGMAFVVVLIVTFVSCLIWYLVKGDQTKQEP